MNIKRGDICLAALDQVIIDFRINNGTDIGIAVNPLTFILSPVVGGEGRVRGSKYVTQCSITFAKLNRKEISKTRPQITAKKIIASTPASRSCKVKVGKGEFPLDIIPTFGYDGI